MLNRRPEKALFLGDSAATCTLRGQIAAASRTNSRVLITGETGAGKEVVARLIHEQSRRSGRAFVAVNCAGIPESLLESELFGHVRGSFTGAYRDKLGLIRQAHGGTLLLDELGEMSLRMQSVLLRYVETGELQPIGADGPSMRTDVRLITATNRNLRERVAAGAFREDLFYRVNVVQIVVPPLRERRDDVPILLKHYLHHTCEAQQIPSLEMSPAAMELLTAYTWPGNVRELKNVVERLVVRVVGRVVVQCEDLPKEILMQRTGRDHPTEGTLEESADLAGGDSPISELFQLTPPPPDDVVQQLWQQLIAGENFWNAVHRPFKNRELTRKDLAALIDVGLRYTHGNYRVLLETVNLPPSDYKRFHAFLYQQKCNLPVRPYRLGSHGEHRHNAVA